MSEINTNPKLGHNEQAFLEFIEEMALEYKQDTLSIDWVKWMLKQISESNRPGVVINPKWLRANSHSLGDTEPPMFIQ